MIRAILMLILIVLGILYIPEGIKRDLRETIYQSYLVVKDLMATDPQERKGTSNTDSLENSPFKKLVERDFFEDGAHFQTQEARQKDDYQDFMKFYKEMSHKLSYVTEILEGTHDKE
ncbi:MAG TPA: hypothetical protein EYP21_02395 [Syntrophaceae bacterium]|nr:hypothetical protein [Syntrophaceae bacterium]